jgi:glycosyltransferase involved in cell wall biosynthesis
MRGCSRHRSTSYVKLHRVGPLLERMICVGYVHVGAPEHGVTRFGKLLAGAIRQCRGVRIVELDVQLETGWWDNRSGLREIARCLADSDVVHLQYNNHLSGSVWGSGWSQLVNMMLLMARIRAPLVLTVHDVYPSRWRGWTVAARHPLREVRRACRAIPLYLTLQFLRRRASCLIVCSEEERARLAAKDAGIAVIPHFVEVRSVDIAPERAKTALGLDQRRVVTILGYIHPRKGHRLLIEALPELPLDVVAVFAGGAVPGDQNTITELLRIAEDLGVRERLRITGYLSESDLEKCLIATDVAVCPFTTLAASSSLSTWVSVNRPVVASSLPQIAEYNSLEPGAIRTFSPYTPRALAAEICDALAGNGMSYQASDRLRSRLLLPRIAARHVDLYMQLAGSTSSLR